MHIYVFFQLENNYSLPVVHNRENSKLSSVANRPIYSLAAPNPQSHLLFQTSGFNKNDALAHSSYREPLFILPEPPPGNLLVTLPQCLLSSLSLAPFL